MFAQPRGPTQPTPWPPGLQPNLITTLPCPHTHSSTSCHPQSSISGPLSLKFSCAWETLTTLHLQPATQCLPEPRSLHACLSPPSTCQTPHPLRSIFCVSPSRQSSLTLRQRPFLPPGIPDPSLLLAQSRLHRLGASASHRLGEW